MSISFIIKFEVKEDAKAEFSSVMNNVRLNLPESRGCISVDIHRGSENESSYILVEKWETREFHEKHVEGLLSSGEWEKMASLLSEEPTGEYYTKM
ncbi:hypothetical protein MNBD_GAMMA10-2598 [hydrothermal vent metagenome]|uniref:ABM domain-containing protein n=1 Tax=hydrothermal vent metagenome TaxID=652676 RepID=A0A3B0Y150_9ZZZZ